MSKKNAVDLIDELLKRLDAGNKKLSKRALDKTLDSLTELSEKLNKEMAKRDEALKKEKKSEKAEEKPSKADEKVFEDSIIDLDLSWEGLTEDSNAADKAESAQDGYLMCLNRFGSVDINYISNITGLSVDTVISQLKGVIFQNPDTWCEDPMRGWESADEYLSGNILQKWRRAKKAVREYGDRFKINVAALRKSAPDSIDADDIYVTLGSPWVPSTVIDDFIYYLVGFPKPKRMSSELAVNHVSELGLWEIPAKNRFDYTRFSVKANSIYGTSRIGMLHILENTLNMKTIAIHDTVPSKTSKKGETRVINETETTRALEKQEKLISEFRSWIFKDEKRKEELYKIYDSRFGKIKQRRFDGSYLKLPYLNPEVRLYPYQKDAVARIITTPNTLLAHDVGSGKTYTMIVAGMEMKRMKISEKNMYVVPNNLTGQWSQMFRHLYPHAKITVVEPKSFKPDKRQAVLERLRDESFDAIIIAYSCFELISLSVSHYTDALSELTQFLTDMRNNVLQKHLIEKKLKSIRGEFEKIKERLSKYKLPTFDELGINTLFIDESHNFKNVPIETKITKVLGISSTGSAKCKEMMDKILCVQKQNNGRGVVLATGTPITNSITDAFVVQKMLQGGELALLEIDSFDSWVGMFAEKCTEFEVDVDTGSYRLATRFSRFHNLPELTNILASVADFHMVSKENGIPVMEGYTDALVGKTDDFTKYLEKISKRADAVRSGSVPRTEDNLLKITTDGRKAALDIRLTVPKAKFTYQSKVARCAENVFEIYAKTEKEKLTQLVFCDTSTPKKEFNLYDEMTRLLCLMGMPEDKIAYVHDATTEKKRTELFEAVQKGEIRVLMGSTFKLGLGVNVQNRLIALHHLDVPWRPADMVQREGRILRQGNMNEKVQIFRYITEGSFDAYSWQLLETKQRFISELLSGSIKDRTGGDIDSTVLNYAEVKALAIGNPLIKRRVELANQLTKYTILHAEALEERERLTRELLEIPARVERVRSLISVCARDIEYYKESKMSYDKDEIKDIRERIDGAIKANVNNPQETEILTYHGFKVIVPAYITEEKPCVYLEHEGRYLVEMGSEIGIIRRLDFFLDTLDRQREKYRETIVKYVNREKSLKHELSGEVGYTLQIKELRRLLSEIDKELGVA